MSEWSDLRRAWQLAIVAVVLTFLFCTPSPALIVVGMGNDPVADAGWPLGAVDVANLKTRVGWYEGPPFGGGEWCFLYRGDTAALNEALKAMGGIRAAALKVVLHDGPQNSPFLADPNDPKADSRVDWSFTVWVPANWHRLYNDPRSTFAADQENFRRPVAPPRLDVYVTPKIDWRQVKVPDDVQLVDERASSGKNGAPPDGPNATLRGDVFDMATGKPIDGVSVRVERSGDRQNVWERAAAGTSDKTGRFRVADIPPGNYRVVASATGYAPRRVAYEQFQRGGARKLTIELSKATRFAGTVTDGAAKPVAGMTVRASNTMGIDGRGYPLPDARETKTDDKGQFTLDGLPAGYLQGWCDAPGWFHVDGLKLFAIPDPSPVALRVVATGGIRGRLVDSNGKPTTGTVSVNPPGDPIGKWGGSTNVAADGTFEFKDVPPGAYTASSKPQLPGIPRDPNAVEINVTSGNVTTVTVKQ